MRQAYIPQVSDSELELMRIVWAKGGTALFAQVMEELQQREMDWKKNTVLTFLSRLIEKKLLSTRKIGHRNEYSAVVSEKEYLAAQTRHFLDKVYEGNVNGLVATLLQQELLTSDDMEQLRAFWNGGEQADG